jgi:predicted AlkP superfamily phosphohydrolase/phosphomutase
MKLLLIGLDAAELTLVREWIDDGSLPNLKSLRERGSLTPLRSSADWLVGSPWPTFYTGTSPAEHGLFHYLLWDPETMSNRRPSPEWLPLRPFWRRLGEHGRRVLAIDVPLTCAPEPIDGVEIAGWATHELLVPPGAHPPAIMDWVGSRFGPPPRDEEEYLPLPARRLIRIRDQLVTTTGRVADLACGLMEREAWDLSIVCFGTTHRGGHKLWDLSGMSGEATPEEERALSGALKEVYRACDAAVGRLVTRAGEGATTMVFSLHGMGPNRCRADLLPGMLHRVLAGTEPGVPDRTRTRLAEQARNLVPERFRAQVKRRLPMKLQDRLTSYWRTDGIEWETTKAFAMLSDLQGWIRVNLAGREAAGIVEPGEEYDRLCQRIADGMTTFVDADTGQPVIDAVVRRDEIFEAGKRSANLPDLLVRWSTSPAAAHRAVISPHHGTVAWPTPGKHPSGRSGNHRATGFLISAGQGMAGASAFDDAHILDLAPTVFRLMELAVPEEMTGRPLF